MRERAGRGDLGSADVHREVPSVTSRMAERPKDWRSDLDPEPAGGFGTVRRVAYVVREIPSSRPY